MALSRRRILQLVVLLVTINFLGITYYCNQKTMDHYCQKRRNLARYLLQDNNVDDKVIHDLILGRINESTTEEEIAVRYPESRQIKTPNFLLFKSTRMSCLGAEFVIICKEGKAKYAEVNKETRFEHIYSFIDKFSKEEVGKAWDEEWAERQKVFESRVVAKRAVLSCAGEEAWHSPKPEKPVESVTSFQRLLDRLSQGNFSPN